MLQSRDAAAMLSATETDKHVCVPVTSNVSAVQVSGGVYRLIHFDAVTDIKLYEKTRASYTQIHGAQPSYIRHRLSTLVASLINQSTCSATVSTPLAVALSSTPSNFSFTRLSPSTAN